MLDLEAFEEQMRDTPLDRAFAVIAREQLAKSDGFAVHEALYARCSSRFGSPVPAWVPDDATIARANVTDALQALGLSGYDALHAWSVANRADYWQLVTERLGISFRRASDRVLEMRTPTQPVWFPGASINIVESCFQAESAAVAIVSSDAGGKIETTTYGGLKAEVGRIANALVERGVRPGDAVAIVMPMSARAVACYLAVIAVGAAAVSIAESFAPEEIAVRVKIAGASLVLTQSAIRRAGKTLPLYEKVVAAGAPRIVIVGDDPPATALREGDLAWSDFMSDKDQFEAIVRSPQAPVNILFSSGTTGEPKAIPWDHTTPLKCAADAHFHQDVHPGDVLCWPTSLGWMMGPWLVFAALLNGAALALYEDAPTDPGFGKFVQDAGVTMLGLVPSIVRAWRASGSMEGYDWSGIRAFSSSGECSNPSDMLYLMFLAGYKPVIEYCGGTEIGGAYVTGTVVQPCVPATFTTAALGIDFATFGEEGLVANPGEVFLNGPSIGLSTRLLNRDHDAIYFADSPSSTGEFPWRKHGDEVDTLPNGSYRMLGRCDDTMNLGGIKVSCIEIEQTLNSVDGVHETAAVALAREGGGPSLLHVYAVLKPGVGVGEDELKGVMQSAIRKRLNPLFQIAAVHTIEALPRTASNKIIRRALRDTK